MPLIAYNNDLGIVNSHHFLLTKFNDDGTCTVENQYKVQRVRVPDAKMKSLFRYGWCDTIARVQGGALSQPYNIVDIQHMTRNDLYTAVSRTTKWEYIGVDIRKHQSEYLPVEYPFVCRTIEPRKKEVAEGVIYEKRFTENGKLFYIGRTNDEEKREAEHKRNPTSPEMAEALGKPYTTTVVARYMCTTKQLDKLETEMIRRALRNGEDLLNKKKVAVAKREEKKPTVVHTVVITKYPITDDTDRQELRIRFGKETKKFRYASCGLEEAMKKAKAFQAALIKELLV
jgi:hypothetical protein